MQRYFLTDQVTLKEPFVLNGEIFHHVTRVMRMREHQKVLFVQPDESVFMAEILLVSKADVQFQAVEEVVNNVELPHKVTIICGLSKGSKADLIVQKGTEMGAYDFIFFESQFSVSKWDEKKSEKKVERLNKIAKEAAEQAHRSHCPKVLFCKKMTDLFDCPDLSPVRLVAWEESAKAGEQSQFATTLQKLSTDENIAILFGPEGGLSPDEISQLNDHHFQPVGLGPRILRAETAPLYALAAISYATELEN